MLEQLFITNASIVQQVGNKHYIHNVVEWKMHNIQLTEFTLRSEG